MKTGVDRSGTTQRDSGEESSAAGQEPCMVANGVAQGIRPKPADPKIRDQILGILEAKGEKAKSPKSMLRRNAGRLLLSWLCQNGFFVQSDVGPQYYFYRPERHLYSLEPEEWAAFLHYVSGANPAAQDHKCLAADCATEARRHGRQLPVVRVSAWDEHAKTLRITRFDGMVYCLDGESITLEHNGDSILFYDDPSWQPYSPRFDGSTVAALHWSTGVLPKWDKDPQHYSLAYRAWMLVTFFVELCPTRPILVVIGEKGSGKSMILRVFLRLLLGPRVELSGVPMKADDLRAAASNAHILVMDNLDQFTPRLRDTLARISTGTVDQFRMLYTSNYVGWARYRCWLAITARTPDTLKRDDLADRSLFLHTRFISDHERQPEREFLAEVLTMRDRWWGDVLLALNAMVATIRGGGLSAMSRLRMADWESLGRLVAQSQGAEELWDELVEKLKRQQSGFLLEDNLVVEALDIWMRDPTNHGRDMTTRELYQDLSLALFDERTRPSDWPRSVQAFGKRLAGIRRDLRSIYRVEWREERARKKVYQFWPLDE